MGDLLKKNHVQNGLTRSKIFTLRQINELSTAITKDVSILASAIEELEKKASTTVLLSNVPSTVEGAMWIEV